jgi:release factor glutamine methyltransferase
MQNVQESITQAQAELKIAGVDAPRLTAELLMGYVLGWDRIRVLAHYTEPIGKEALDRFQVLVRRRAAGEPLQYLVERQEFYGHSFRVTPAVLVPRPETELLVETALRLAKDKGSEKLRFLDVGTGSGCIAISVALGWPGSCGWALDISPDALSVARENAASHNVSGRIHFACGDYLEPIAQKPFFHFIFSNPPYVAEADAAILPPTVRDYEPGIALFSGASGMNAYRRIIPASASRLLPGGYLLLEVGAGMSTRVADLARQHDMVVEAVLEDLQSIPRCVVARRHHG